MRIQVLGPIAVIDTADTEPSLSTSLRQVLALLVAAGERGMLQDSIAEELWGEDLPATWESAFRNAVTRLRTKLGKNALVATSGRYHLNRETVDVDAWELMERAETGSADFPNLGALLAGVPFEGVEHSPTIRLMAERIEVARASLIRMATTDGSVPLDASALAMLRAHQRRNPLDDGLLEHVVRAHLRAGHTTRSLAILTEARIEAAEDDRIVSPDLIALEEAIRRQRSPGPLLAQVAIEQRPSTIPALLAPLLHEYEVGRKAELHRLLSGIADRAMALLTGAAGSGKTRLLATAADHLTAAGYDVRYVAGTRDHNNSFGPLLVAVPEAAPAVRRLLTAEEDVGLIQARCNAAILDALLQSRPKRICLLIDDGHLLDSHTERFALFAQSQSSVPVALVVATRPGAVGNGSSLQRSLREMEPPTVDLSPLTHVELFELATRVHPNAGARLLSRLAEDVLRLTAGLPGLARHLIDRVDPDTLLLDLDVLASKPGTSPLLSYAQALEPNVRRSAVAGAVLGSSFELTELSLVSEQPVDTVREHCEELTAAGFVDETATPDRHAFVHALHREAILQDSSPAQLRRLHRRASEVIQDRKRRARHLAAAVPLVTEEDACTALIEASAQYFAEGAWREAASSLREAQRRRPEMLERGDLLRFAASLDLSGSDGSVVRARVFEESSSAGNWSKALEAATSGMQAAERVHGEPRRVELLERIPPDELSRKEQFGLADALVRQLMFLGREEDAAEWSDRAAAVAATPDERLMTLVHSVLTGRSGDDTQPLDLPLDLSEVQNTIVGLRGLQIAVLSHLERSPAQTSRPLVQRLEYMTREADDPYRSWHYAVLADTLHFVNGELIEAGERAERTHLFGEKFGIGDAEGAFLAFRFFWRAITGDLSLLRPDYERYQKSGASIVHRMMTSVIRTGSVGAMGDEELRTVFWDAVASRSIFAIPALVLGTPFVADRLDVTTRSAVYDRLTSRAGTSAIVANGVVHAGPVDRVLSLLAPDRASREAHLVRAVEVADSQDLLLWRALTRRDLERHGITVRPTAMELAAGRELERLLVDRSP